MDWVRLLLDLPAIVGASSMVSLLSPVKLPPRCAPLLLFLTGLIVWFLPIAPLVALAMMLPAALIQKFLGIDLHGHEAADYGPAVAKARSAAQKAAEHVRAVKPAVVTEFVTKAYGHVDDATALPANEPENDRDDTGDSSTASTNASEPEQDPGEALREKLDTLTRDPRLPAGAAERLAGQRSGRDTSVGLRNGTTRKFVPSLLG